MQIVGPLFLNQNSDRAMLRNNFCYSVWNSVAEKKYFRSALLSGYLGKSCLGFYSFGIILFLLVKYSLKLLSHSTFRFLIVSCVDRSCTTLHTQYTRERSEMWQMVPIFRCFFAAFPTSQKVKLWTNDYFLATHSPFTGDWYKSEKKTIIHYSKREKKRPHGYYSF